MSSGHGWDEVGKKPNEKELVKYYRQNSFTLMPLNCGVECCSNLSKYDLNNWSRYCTNDRIPKGICEKHYQMLGRNWLTNPREEGKNE